MLSLAAGRGEVRRWYGSTDGINFEQLSTLGLKNINFCNTKGRSYWKIYANLRQHDILFLE